MSEMSFEQMLNDSFKTIRNGDVVEGSVISVKPDEIVLNIGYKSDGIITRREYTNDDNLDLTTVVKEGDTLEAIVTKVNDGEGQVLLSYKRLAQAKGNEKLEKAYENQEVITATVTQILNGGLGVLVDETRVFIPASLVSDTFVKDLNQYKDKEISFVITEFNPRKRRIIGDSKQLLVAEKSQKMEELLATLKVGDVITGKVKNITDFGAFIDIGGIDALLPLSQISWRWVDHPSDILKVGDVVNVEVIVVDHDKQRISLSLKNLEKDPWNEAKDKIKDGDKIEGTITRIKHFGAFVEVFPCVEALLPNNELIEYQNQKNVILKAGDKIQTTILKFNPDDRRISLSIKDVE